MQVKSCEDIRIYLKAIPEYFCKDLIAKFRKGADHGQVIAGHVSAEGVSEYRNQEFLTAKDLHLADHADWSFVNADLHTQFILPCLKDYLQNYMYVLPTSVVDPGSCIMSLYEKNKGHFAPHKDSMGGLQSTRSLTIICYLNDVYHGGETRFFNQNFSVMPRTGSIAIFPSNFIYGHKGCPPVSNDKYITVSFAAVDVGDESLYARFKTDEARALQDMVKGVKL